MPNIPAQPREKIVRALTRAYGCFIIREGKKHTVFARDNIPEVITVPRHRTISPGVIRNICKILKVTVADFIRTLRHC